MYTTTVIEYLQAKQGKTHPTTMTTDDAAILGIAYPMRPGWLAEHGPRRIDMPTMIRLLDALGKRVERTLHRRQIGAKKTSFDVCLEHKKNLEEFFGEPVYVHQAVVEQESMPAPAKPTKAERRRLAKEAAKQRKSNTQVATEIKAHRAKTAPRRRASIVAMTVEGVDVRSKDFLSTYAWTNLRIKVLNLYGRKCMCCGDSPENGAVMNVDHIQPRLRFPSLALDARNLQVLCGPCNKGKCNELETDYRTPAQVAAAVALAKTL